MLPPAAAAVDPSAAAAAESLNVADEVFVSLPDGCFHSGRIVTFMNSDTTGTARCLVLLADGTEYWSLVDEVQRLGDSSDTMPCIDVDAICVVCKSPNTVDKNEMPTQICEQCGKAYHLKCALDVAIVRRIYNNALDDNERVWFCLRGHRNVTASAKRTKLPTLLSSKIDENVVAAEEESSRRCAAVQHTKSTLQLPFRLDALSWDKQHHYNEQQMYCYCAGSGEWYRQMLQCCRCRQWFHERCIAVLTYPLYCGDGFYVFACAVCNGGTEIVRRQQIDDMDDVVQLLLFNLHVHHPGKEFFGLNDVILPYAIDNWQMLQLKRKVCVFEERKTCRQHDNVFFLITYFSFIFHSSSAQSSAT